MGGEDWWNYHNNAQNAISRNPNLIVMLFIDQAELFSKCVAVLYGLFGIHTMYINLFVFASSLIAARNVFKTAMILTNGDIESSTKALMYTCILMLKC